MLEKMAKNLVSSPILAPQIFFVGFTSTRCCKLLQAIIYALLRKTNEPNLRKWQKNLVSDPIVVPLSQTWVLEIFIHGFYLH